MNQTTVRADIGRLALPLLPRLATGQGTVRALLELQRV